MYKRENKFFFVIVILFFIISCSKQESKEKDIITLSKGLVGEKEYNKIYKQANDSLKIWSVAKLETYRSEWAFNYKLDSILCFNSKKDKMIGALLVQCNQDDCSQDDLHFFYGVKVKEQWYFFEGPDVVLPREYYQKDTNTPLSFEKLHQLAIKEIYAGYLIKENGEYKVNDDFFSDLTSGAWCTTCTTQAKWDSTYIAITKKNWVEKFKPLTAENVRLNYLKKQLALEIDFPILSPDITYVKPNNIEISYRTKDDTYWNAWYDENNNNLAPNQTTYNTTIKNLNRGKLYTLLITLHYDKMLRSKHPVSFETTFFTN